MNQYQIAAHIVPCVLRAANTANGQPLDADTMIALSGTLSTAVSLGGEKNRKAIVKAGLKISPDFATIAEDFFLALAETPVIAETSCTKEYQEIAEFVIENKELAPKERFQLYTEEHTASSVKFWKGFRIVCLSLVIICAIAHICMVLFNPELCQEYLKKFENLKTKAGKVWKHIMNFMKVVKAIIHQLTK